LLCVRDANGGSAAKRASISPEQCAVGRALDAALNLV
jgi:hypothetical protein